MTSFPVGKTSRIHFSLELPKEHTNFPAAYFNTVVRKSSQVVMNRQGFSEQTISTVLSPIQPVKNPHLYKKTDQTSNSSQFCTEKAQPTPACFTSELSKIKIPPVQGKPCEGKPRTGSPSTVFTAFGHLVLPWHTTASQSHHRRSLLRSQSYISSLLVPKLRGNAER